MKKPTYSAALLAKFDRLTLRLSSRDQMERIDARMAVTAFVSCHSREVVDAMFAELQERDKRNITTRKFPK